MAVTEGQLISYGTAVWKVKKIGNGELPAGTMQMFAGNTIPAGWLLCDGSAISRTDYSELFEVIGTTYGAGDGSTTFNLPNLIDRFLQGSATAGTYKAAGLPNITGWFGQRTSSNTIADNVLFTKNTSGVNSEDIAAGAVGSGKVYFDASRVSSVYGASTTVQPPALTMLPIIKY